jgi:allantoate deiminase
VSVDRARLERRIGDLSAIGGSGTSVTRLGLSPEEQRARDLIGGWLRARGATVWRDAAANIYGRFGAAGPAILVGSHIDSVPEGGRFDGALGVLCAVEAVDALLDDGLRFRRPVEVVGWCDEEGARSGRVVIRSRRSAIQATSRRTSSCTSSRVRGSPRGASRSVS